MKELKLMFKFTMYYNFEIEFANKNLILSPDI